MSDKVAYSRHGDIAVLRIQNPPVNALSQAVRAGLVQTRWTAPKRMKACTPSSSWAKAAHSSRVPTSPNSASPRLSRTCPMCATGSRHRR